MLKGAVARRYAEAVMELAVEQETVDRWLADLRLIGEAFGNRRLAFVLREPNIPFQRKELIVRDLLADKVQHDALSLALLLVQDNLVEAAPRLAQEFERLYDDYRGQAKAQVTTVMPLDEAERAHIAGALQQLTGKRILMQERVDPAILGGVVARVGDTLIDGSVKRRLMLLREQIVKGGGSFGGPQDGRPGSEPDEGPEAGGGPAPSSGAGGSFVVSSAPDGGSTASGGSPDTPSDDGPAGGSA